MKFDDDEMQQVARTILHYNEYARGLTVSEIVARMHSTAYCELSSGARYCSTMGFVLTAFSPRWEQDVIHVKASVCSWLVDPSRHGLQ